jgi:hypothetical protein
MVASVSLICVFVSKQHNGVCDVLAVGLRSLITIRLCRSKFSVRLKLEESRIGLPALWAIGVGSVLGGDFFGWQFVLEGG